MTNWSQKRLKKQLLPIGKNLKPESRRVEVRVVTLTRIGILNQGPRFTGKRKAEAEADPKREKKKSREVSEPLEESEPEPGRDLFYQLTLSASYPCPPNPLTPFPSQRQQRSDVALLRRQLPEYFKTSYPSSMARYASFETGASSMAQ